MRSYFSDARYPSDPSSIITLSTIPHGNRSIHAYFLFVTIFHLLHYHSSRVSVCQCHFWFIVDKQRAMKMLMIIFPEMALRFLCCFIVVDIFDFINHFVTALHFDSFRFGSQPARPISRVNIRRNFDFSKLECYDTMTVTAVNNGAAASDWM